MGLVRSDGVADSLQEALQYPSLNIRGLSSGWTGAASRTIIPPNAVAELDIRLVMESDPDFLVSWSPCLLVCWSPGDKVFDEPTL